MDAFFTVGGIVSCVVGGIFHMISVQKNRTVHQLEHHVVSLDGGRTGIQSVVDMLPLMVALTGTIFCKKAVSCSLSEKECAIVERVEEKKVESLVNNVWISGYETLSVDRREEVFGVLVDDVVVPIVRPMVLEGKYLVQSGEVFEPNSNAQSLVHHVVGQVSGHRDLGTRTTEKCLPIGAVVTAIGELAWDTVQKDETFSDSDGAALMRNPGGLGSSALVLRPPSGRDKDRLHFMLWEGTSFTNIIEMYRGAASFAGTASVYCYVLGACMIGTTVLRTMHRKYRERVFLKNFRQALDDKRHNVSSEERRESATTVAEEDDGSSHVCVVCLDAPSTKAYACGHLCICTACSSRGSAAIKCPICRAHGKPIVIYSV